jgi:hypothetical protein
MAGSCLKSACAPAREFAIYQCTSHRSSNQLCSCPRLSVTQSLPGADYFHGPTQLPQQCRLFQRSRSNSSSVSVRSVNTALSSRCWLVYISYFRNPAQDHRCHSTNAETVCDSMRDRMERKRLCGCQTTQMSAMKVGAEAHDCEASHQMATICACAHTSHDGGSCAGAQGERQRTSGSNLRLGKKVSPSMEGSLASC